MPRRKKPPYDGRRYLGNTKDMKVHDLDHEKTKDGECQIDEIKHEHVKMFDRIWQAEKKGFHRCTYCF